MFHLGYALIALEGRLYTTWLILKGHVISSIIIGIFAIIILVDYSVNHKPGADSECPMKKKEPGIFCV